MRFVLIAVALILLIARCGAVEPRPDLRAAYGEARASLVARKDDAPGLGVALDRAWSALANWTAGYLDEHPDVTATQLARAVVALDPPRRCAETDERCFNEYHLNASAVRLNTNAFAIAANYPKSGTFFVVARARDGHFRSTWNIKDVARHHYASHDEIGYWAWNGSGWGDGPAIGAVGALPPSASGLPRFSVTAGAATDAGGTFRNQFSVWEWSGNEAKPLFIESYQVSFDTEPVKVKDGEITIPMKGSYKSLITCGACAEPHVFRHLRLAPDGLHNLGTTYGEPEMRSFDELWDRLIREQPADDLASAQVIAALAPMLPQVRRDAGADLERSLGMLNNSKIVEENGRRYLLVEADNLDCKQLRFEVETRGAAPHLANLRVVNPCR